MKMLDPNKVAVLITIVVIVLVAATFRYNLEISPKGLRLENVVSSPLERT